MALNFLNEKPLNEYIAAIVFQDNPPQKIDGNRGVFESSEAVREKSDIIARCIVYQYMKHRLRGYLDEMTNEPALVLVDKTRADLPNWTTGAIKRGENIYEFDGERMSPELREKITTVRDYLYTVAHNYVNGIAQRADGTEHKPQIRYDYLKTNNELSTFDAALVAAEKWHDEIARNMGKGGRSENFLQESLRGAELVMELPNEMFAYKLTTTDALDFESEHMGHCVGSGGYDAGVKGGTTEIYSIRDKKGEPHVTLDVRGAIVHQCKGKQNKRPVTKYMPSIAAFINSKKFDITGDIKNTGMIKVGGEWYSIYNLPAGLVIDGDLDLSTMELTELPDLTGITVCGNFICNYNQLTSLAGAPQTVGGNFDCSYNQLTSLDGAPQKVGGVFDCSYNQLTSLTGAPQKVGGNFYCDNNQLSSLVGGPKKVGGNFDCSHNRLTSLTGAPQKVGGGFFCNHNQLTSLVGGPKKVGGNFICRNNRLTSLTGAPQTVGGSFVCKNNQLTSLTGAPQTVGGDFVCGHNQLTSLTGAPQTVGRNFYCGRNQLTSLVGGPKKVGSLLFENNPLPDNVSLYERQGDKVIYFSTEDKSKDVIAKFNKGIENIARMQSRTNRSYGNDDY